MEYQYNIAGHLCRIVFCDAGNDSSLLPSFSPFESEEEGNLLFCLSVDDAFRWPVTGEEVGQFDCGGNNFGVYRLPDGSYQFEICDEKKALCCYLQANADFSDCRAALVAESDAGRKFGLNNALMLVYAFASAPYATLLMHASVIRNDGRGYLFLTRVRDNIQKSKEQKNIQPTKGGHKMVTCQNYVSLFYCQITSCPSDGGIS